MTSKCKMQALLNVPDPGSDPAEILFGDSPVAEYDQVGLRRALRKLDRLQLLVVRWTFGLDGLHLEQAEIAARLGISDRHVRRLLTAALYSLRMSLGPQTDDTAAASASRSPMVAA